MFLVSSSGMRSKNQQRQATRGPAQSAAGGALAVRFGWI
jgi:hypothetical protein